MSDDGYSQSDPSDPFTRSFAHLAIHRPSLPLSISSSSASTCSSSESSILTPASSVLSFGIPMASPGSAGLTKGLSPSASSDCHDLAAAPLAATLSSAPGSKKGPLSPELMLAPLASSAPIHSFPSFTLALLTALESDPASIAHHLSNLAASHAAPATFMATPEGKPAETDAIVACLSRIADRLQPHDQLSPLIPPSDAFAHRRKTTEPTHATAAATDDTEANAPNGQRDGEPLSEPELWAARRPTVVGETLEEVRRNYEDQIQALKVLHAEELHRSQLSHDNEVRYVRAFSAFRGPCRADLCVYNV